MITRLRSIPKALILFLFLLVLLFAGQPHTIAYAQETTPTAVTPEATTVPPAEIPEPITVILFGTGLAALSAASARRRKQDE
ncbi:MAG: PEP-CTERM sorting domain-containing protein [Caldilineaceae bacterium]